MTLAERIIGSWLLQSSFDIDASDARAATWGDAPLGTYMFDRSGRFAQIVMRSDLERFPRREDMTAEAALALAMGSLAMFGTYTVDEVASCVTVRFEACTFAGFIGTTGSRYITFLSDDEMMISNAGRAGGRRGESVWRRAD